METENSIRFMSFNFDIHMEFSRMNLLKLKPTPAVR